MLHLVAFDSSIVNGSTFTKISALQTEFENVQNNNLVVDPKLVNIMALYLFGANVARGQLQSPSLQIPAYPDITPLNKLVASSSVHPNYLDYTQSPMVLRPTEQLSAYSINGGVAAENEILLMLLSDGPIQPVKGSFRTVRFSGSTTLTPHAWTSCSMTSEQNLPAGNYTVIGARARSAGAIGFRLGVPGLVTRPGGVAVQTVDAEEPRIQRAGGLGAWFSFAQNINITMDVLSTSADTAEYLELDIVGPQ